MRGSAALEIVDWAVLEAGAMAAELHQILRQRMGLLILEAEAVGPMVAHQATLMAQQAALEWLSLSIPTRAQFPTLEVV